MRKYLFYAALCITFAAGFAFPSGIQTLAALFVGSTPISGGSNGDCLKIATGKLGSGSCGASSSGNKISFGTNASFKSTPPAGPASGDEFICTDSPYSYIWNGAAWQAYAFGFAVTEPVLGSLTQVGTVATYTTTYGGIQISSPSNGGSQNVAYVGAAIPGAGGYCVDAAFTGTTWVSNGGGGVGLSAGLLTSSAFFFNSFGQESGVYGLSNKLYTSTTAFSANRGALSGSNAIIGPMMWIRVFDDRTTNRTSFVSSDGHQWRQFYQEARTTTFTPADAIFAVGPFQSPIDIWLIHWNVYASPCAA